MNSLKVDNINIPPVTVPPYTNLLSAPVGNNFVFKSADLLFFVTNLV